MPDEEIQSVIAFSHTEACGGNFRIKKWLPRYSNMDSTGPLCLETRVIIVDNAKHVRNREH